MDGWESRRKRIEGHDCILKLPVSCNIKGLVIDAHFLEILLLLFQSSC